VRIEINRERKRKGYNEGDKIYRQMEGAERERKREKERQRETEI